MKNEKSAFIKRHFASAALLATSVAGYINGGIVLDATILAGAVGASFASYSKIIVSRGNFRTVHEGQSYRSAQLGKKRLQKEISAHNLKAMLNLRGPRPEKSWYQDEIEVCKRNGVEHYDFALPAGKKIPLEQMDALVALMRDAPKPFLSHCRAGADRSGLAVGLYSYAIQGNPLHIAMRQLSLIYGHFPYLISSTGAMGQSLQDYAEAHPHEVTAFAQTRPRRFPTLRFRGGIAVV